MKKKEFTAEQLQNLGYAVANHSTNEHAQFDHGKLWVRYGKSFKSLRLIWVYDLPSRRGEEFEN